MSAIAQQLEPIVGASNLHLWHDLNLPLQQRIRCAVLPPQPQAAFPVECVVYPQTQEQLGEVVACAETNRWRWLPCGCGSKLKWGGLARGVQLVVSTARLNRLIDHAAADMTVTVEAGMQLADLQATLAKTGQFLAIDPSYSAEATLGGIVATADSGPLRHRYGGIRDALIGITVVRADGAIAKAGGRVVKNVAGYDLMKLFTGSWGTLGTLSQLTFRVYPQPEASQTLVMIAGADVIAAIARDLLASALTPTAVELIAPPTVLGYPAQPNRIALVVRFQGIPVSIEKQTEQLEAIAHQYQVEGDRYTDSNEVALWQQLRETWEADSQEPHVTCKIGVLPNQTASVLQSIYESFLPQQLQLGTFHAGSGLGLLRFRGEQITPSLLQTLREKYCQANGGFLSVLEAPADLKRQMDVWGYPGNAFQLMKSIKNQFDPHHLLSPHRFVNGL